MERKVLTLTLPAGGIPVKQLIACCLLSISFSQTAVLAQQPADPLVQSTLKAAQQANEAAELATEAGATIAAQDASQSAKKAAEKANQLRAIQYSLLQRPADSQTQSYLLIAQREAQQAIQNSQQATQAALKAAQEASRAAQQAAAQAALQATLAAQEAQAAEQSSRRSAALRTMDLLGDALDSYFYNFKKLPSDDDGMKRFVEFAYKHVLNQVANPGDLPTSTSRGHAIFQNLEMAYDDRVSNLPRDFNGQYVLPTDSNWQWEPGTTRIVTDGKTNAMFLSQWTQPRLRTVNGSTGARYNFAVDLR